MPRNKEYDPEQLLDDALKLFWDRGYTNTSMEEIVQSTGVSRRGIYTSFGDKEGLFQNALEKCQQEMEQYVLAPLEKEGASLSEIQELFASFLRLGRSQGMGRGCFLCNTAVENASHHPEVMKTIKTYFNRMRRGFKKALQRAREEEKISHQLDPEVYASYLVGVVKGMAMMARTESSSKMIKDYVQVSLSVLTN